MCEAVGELAVVRQQERAGRVGVEPADGHDPLREIDKRDDGRPPLRVARGRDRARRLVQQHVGETLRYELLAVEADDVGGGDEGVQLPGLAVHGDAPGLDQLVGAAPGRNPGARQPCVEPHVGRHPDELSQKGAHPRKIVTLPALTRGRFFVTVDGGWRVDLLPHPGWG
jgi:hypothetical protein